MRFGQKTLKSFSFDLLHDLEASLLDTLEAGVSSNWKKWHPLISKGILDKAEVNAIKNKRSTDFSTFYTFKQNLDFADPVELIVCLAGKENDYFKKFFSLDKEKNILLQAIGEANRFRNLIFHPAGKTLYISDIKDFLRAGIVISNITGLSSLGLRYQAIEKEIENSIAESSYYIKDSVDLIYNNLPKPDYEEWYGLVGRTAIKSEILGDFQKGNNRVIAITGGGGIGKSALALDICYEYLKPTNFLFKHIVWITSKNNFLDYSGISQLKPAYFYNNNYKDFLNQFISGFYQELFITNLESITEEDLESRLDEILNTYDRILCVVDNLENIDDPKILDFIKNRIIPPNYVLITSRKGLGEINKTYKLEPLDDISALKLFENLCKSPLFNIDYSGINVNKIKQLLKTTNNYPLVIKWCLSLVANKKMEMEGAFSELNKPHNFLLEFIFQKLYKQLSRNSKKILRSLALYKDIPDRNIIAYIAEIDTEEELMDAIFELEQHSLINQKRIDSKNGIIETINLLGLAQTFINSIVDIDKDLKDRFEKRMIEIEQELDRISTSENCDFRPAQKLAQSKLLQALKMSSEKIFLKKSYQNLIREAERLAPRFYLIPFYKALIEMNNQNYEYLNVKQYFIESLSAFSDDPRVLSEYGKLLRKHKKESSNEYAPIFLKAFELDKKIGSGIDAGIAFFESGDFSKAYIIIQKIKEVEPSFPKDNQHKLWTSKTVINIVEGKISSDNIKAMSLLNSIESNIDLLAAEKTKDYRMLKAKFCSLLGLSYALDYQPLKAREFLNISREILMTYKSVTNNCLETKEILCYNHVTGILLCNDNSQKSDRYKKLVEEISGTHNKTLLTKFSPLIKIIKKNFLQ